MKKSIIIALLFVVTTPIFAQIKTSKLKKMETKEHYTFTLSDKVTRQK